MEPILIVAFLVGAGALASSVASRRAAERSAPRADRSAAQAATAREPALEEATPERLERAAPAPSPPASTPAPARVNRRKHARIKSDQTFTVTPFAGRALMAQCSDVSEGGMRFGVVGCTLRAGDLVRVTFNIGSETVDAIGSVLRIAALDPITSDVSLEFVRVDPWAAELLAQALQSDA